MAMSSTYIGLATESVGAHRAYVFDYDLSERTFTNTYEWCAEGMVAQISKFQAVPMDGTPEWMQSVQAHLTGGACSRYGWRSGEMH